LYLVTNPHSHLSGIYYLPTALVAQETGLSPESVEIGIMCLFSEGLVIRDEEIDIVWIRKMLKYQGVYGKKIAKYIATHLSTLHGTMLISSFLNEYSDLSIPYQYTDPKPSSKSESIRQTYNSDTSGDRVSDRVSDMVSEVNSQDENRVSEVNFQPKNGVFGTTIQLGRATDKQEQEQNTEQNTEKNTVASATRADSDRKSKKTSDPRIKRLVDFFHDQHVQVLGEKPHIIGGRDASAIKRLLNTIPDEEELQARIIRYLEDPLEWQDKPNHTITGFEKLVGKYAEATDYTDTSWDTEY
jgi:hypothetical protein